jgi:hypothetical protein
MGVDRDLGSTLFFDFFHEPYILSSLQMLNSREEVLHGAGRAWIVQRAIR